MTDTRTRSSWISSLAYVNGFLVVFLSRGGAILYADVPPYVIGLVTAGQAHAKTTGDDSVGATYHRLVRGQYPSQTIDEKQANEIKQMMEG